MKKHYVFVFIIFIFFVSCASTPKKRSFGEVVDDNVIALKLRTKFSKHKKIPASKIHIRVWKGIVTLKGEVERQQQINKAIEISEKEVGVKEVKAYLVLKEFGSYKDNKKTPFFKKLFKTKPKYKSYKKNKLKEEDIKTGQKKSVISKKENKELEKDQTKIESIKELDSNYDY